MNIAQFQASLHRAEPAPELDLALSGLWWDAKGDWARAHAAAQQDEGPRGAWVHAYLHRKEGDLANANYWYRRARRSPASGAHEAEWESITTALLQVDHG